MKTFSPEFIKNINENDNKFLVLYEIIRSLESVAVAYSGGVDSALVAKVCYDVLKENAVCVTADSPSLPRSDLGTAIDIAKKIGIKHIIIKTNEINNSSYSENSQNRCYFCKSELYREIRKVIQELNFKNIVNGENLSDVQDFRPGSIAGGENFVRSPLKEAGLKKDDVRKLARLLDMPNWNMPANACLASRIAYGEVINKENLFMVEEAEKFIKSLGFIEVRVRYHNKIARIEIPEREIEKLLDTELRSKITKKLRDLGFLFVSIDLEGFKSGSMNRLLMS